MQRTYWSGPAWLRTSGPLMPCRALSENPEGDAYEFKIKCNRWKDLGFQVHARLQFWCAARNVLALLWPVADCAQRDDPISDLRASGKLGIAQLVFFAERYPSLFLEMSRYQQQGDEGMEYPFCTAGINITFLLVHLFSLSASTWSYGGRVWREVWRRSA